VAALALPAALLATAPTVARAAAVQCSVDYRANDWGSGFTVDVTITNRGTDAIDGWVLTYGYTGNQRLTNGWNGVPGTVKGLFYGDASQFGAQCIGTLTCIAFVFVSFFVFFKVVDALMGNRVSAEVELEGLDISEMGALAYPDFVLKADAMGME